MGVIFVRYPLVSNNCSITLDQIKYFVKYAGCSVVCLCQLV